MPCQEGEENQEGSVAELTKSMSGNDGRTFISMNLEHLDYFLNDIQVGNRIHTAQVYTYIHTFIHRDTFTNTNPNIHTKYLTYMHAWAHTYKQHTSQ